MKPEAPRSPCRPIAPIAGHVPPRASSSPPFSTLAFRVRWPAACLAGAQQAAPAAAEAVTLNPVVVSGAPTATEASTCPTRSIRWTCAFNQAGTSA